MKVAVVGAGFTGVATAYELAAQQHEVTVFERRGSVAAEGSFAHSGLLAACAPLPWGIPGLQRQRLGQWLRRQGSIRAGLGTVLAQSQWLWQQWRAGRSPARQARWQALQALAHASRQRVGELTQQLNLAYEQQAGGLVLLADDGQLERVRRALEEASGLAQGLQLLDAEAARALEPGLSPDWPLKGAVQLPSAMVGNGRQLAQLLKSHAQRLGASFRFDTEVKSLRPGLPATLLPADDQAQTFDAIVVCAGAGSRRLLASAQLQLPLLTAWGHAVTAPLSHGDGDGQLAAGPRAAVVDSRNGIVISRLGQRVRATGVTQLGGGEQALPGAVLQQLYGAMEQAFPGCAVTREATHWKGPRVRVPDGAPVVGSSGAQGLWLNLGHGPYGWALACGAAQMLARQLGSQPLPFDASPFSAKRLS